MIAAPYRDDNVEAADRHRIKERLNSSSREARAVASVEAATEILQKYILALAGR